MLCVFLSKRSWPCVFEPWISVASVALQLNRAVAVARRDTTERKTHYVAMRQLGWWWWIGSLRAALLCVGWVCFAFASRLLLLGLAGCVGAGAAVAS